MIWHVALTLFCLLCIICSIVFRERFTFIFPELIIVAFYVMIFSLILPVMIRVMHSIKDLYLSIFFSFLFLAFIILIINIIKRLRQSKKIRTAAVGEGNEDTAAGVSQKEKEQPTIQKVRLKQMILDQRISMAQQGSTLKPVKLNIQEEKFEKPKASGKMEKPETKTPIAKETGSVKSSGGLAQEKSTVELKEKAPATYDIPAAAKPQKVTEPKPIEIGQKPVQAQFNIEILEQQSQRPAFPGKDIMGQPASVDTQTEIRPAEGELVSAVPELLINHLKAEPPVVTEDKSPEAEKEIDRIEAFTIEDETNKQSVETEKEKDSKSQESEVSHFEKEYQTALEQIEHRNYEKALQILKKLTAGQTRPELKKSLEIMILKTLAASGEYQEATNQVYSFLSSGYSLSEEENKEIMDVLYILQENA